MSLAQCYPFHLYNIYIYLHICVTHTHTHTHTLYMLLRKLPVVLGELMIVVCKLMHAWTTVYQVSSPDCHAHNKKQSHNLGEHSWSSGDYYLNLVLSNQIGQFINWSHNFVHSEMAYQKQKLKEAETKATCMKRPGQHPSTIIWRLWFTTKVSKDSNIYDTSR